MRLSVTNSQPLVTLTFKGPGWSPTSLAVPQFNPIDLPTDVQAGLRASSKGFALTRYRALTLYFLCLSSARSHFEPWTAVATRRRGPLAARSRVAGRPAQQTLVLANSTKLKHGTKLGRTLC